MPLGKYRLVLSIVSLIVALSYSSFAIATQQPFLDTIKDRAKDFLQNNITLQEGETLDIQFRSTEMKEMPACSKEVDIRFPENYKEKINSIELVCSGDQNWHTFLPVQVGKITKVVIVNRLILPNETISESDLDFAQDNTSHLYSGYYKDVKEVVGQVATRSIDSGAVLTKKNIHPPLLVHRNQVVDLVARKNMIEVVMKGISKSDGYLNQIITAYNPTTKRTMQAVVIDYNKVEVVS